ncbi:hypothetical protein HanLR1_Chr01g0005751 [Helianthus annuus]|nr:hypothetical protein HanLR1_Chr01g0005751 [Helianthus annuus]
MTANKVNGKERPSRKTLPGTLWKPEDDQAQQRTEHDTVTCFRTSPRCKF